MTKEGMYTTKEVAQILSIDYKRIHKDMKNLIVKPTDIVKGKGRGGITYVFDADTIRSYAAQKGIYNIDFSIVGGGEDEINEDGAVVLTPENFDRIVHGGDESTQEKQLNKNADILRFFKEKYNMTNKDLAFIMNVSEKRVANLMYGHVSLTFDNVISLCTAVGLNNFEMDSDQWFRDDPDRLKRIKSWVPYERAKLMKKYADLQRQMKEIKKQLEEK